MPVRYMCTITSHACLPSSSRRNLAPQHNSSYLKRCEFNPITDHDCPIFRLKDMVSWAGEDFQTMAVKVKFQVTLTGSSQKM